MIIEEGVQNIVRGALLNDSTIKTLTLPDSYTGDNTNVGPLFLF